MNTKAAETESAPDRLRADLAVRETRRTGISWTCVRTRVSSIARAWTTPGAGPGACTPPPA